MDKQPLEYREVTVNCYEQKQANMIVVRDRGEIIEVCSKEEIEAAKQQHREPLTVGFRRESVAEWR